jgi:hypothetical protein
MYINGQGKGFRLGKMLAQLGAVVLVVIMFSGTALQAYAQSYSFPRSGPVSARDIWDNVYRNNAQAPQVSTFSLGYEDNASFTDNSGLLFTVRDTKAYINGNGYFEDVESDNPKIDAKVNYIFSTADVITAGSLGIKAVNQNLYLQTNNTALLSYFGLPSSSNGWVKFGLNELNQEETPDPFGFNSLQDPLVQQKIEKIWSDNHVFDIRNLVGLEEVKGALAFHFKLDLNKQATTKAITETMAVISEQLGQPTDDENFDLAKTIVARLVKKIKIQELDVWVGVGDGNVRKIHLVSNAPSLASILKTISSEAGLETDDNSIDRIINKIEFSARFTMDETIVYGARQSIEEPVGAYDALTQARESSRDAKRMADVRQIASALELHFNDYGDYPTDLAGLNPNYLGELPTPPTPPGRDCTEANNNYTYTYRGAGDYQLRFCLGEDTGGASRGVRVITPTGIN